MKFTGPLRRSLLMGALCSPVGVLIGYMLSREAMGDGWSTFYFFSGTAAFLAPAAVWWLLVEKQPLYSAGRGALAGALGALTAHYLCWYALILHHNVSYWLLGNPGSSLGEPPVDPLRGLWAAWVLSLPSYLFIGWITIPIGSIAGSLYASVLKRRAEGRSAHREN